MSEIGESTTEWLESLPIILRERRFDSIVYSYSEKHKIWGCTIFYGLGKVSFGDGYNLEIASKKALESLEQQLLKDKNDKRKNDKRKRS